MPGGKLVGGPIEDVKPGGGPKQKYAEVICLAGVYKFHPESAPDPTFTQNEKKIFILKVG